jgi:hypothetical protein
MALPVWLGVVDRPGDRNDFFGPETHRRCCSGMFSFVDCRILDMAEIPMKRTLPMRFVYATPLEGVHVCHKGDYIQLCWEAEASCRVRLTPNADGDVQFAGPRDATMSLVFRSELDEPLNIRARLRGTGWLASHTEIWCDHTLDGGLSTLDIDTREFRVCQKSGPAADAMLAGHGGDAFRIRRREHSVRCRRCV